MVWYFETAYSREVTFELQSVKKEPEFKTLE